MKNKRVSLQLRLFRLQVRRFKLDISDKEQQREVDVDLDALLDGMGSEAPAEKAAQEVVPVGVAEDKVKAAPEVVSAPPADNLLATDAAAQLSAITIKSTQEVRSVSNLSAC